MFYDLIENDWGELEYVPTLAGKILMGIVALLIFAAVVFLVKKAGEKKGQKLTAKQIAFCAMAVALGTILSNIKLFKFPTGGSITILFMLAACLPGYWYGVGVGVLAGITSGLLQLIFDPYIIHPAQLVLDYLCAFGALGLSGIFTETQKPKEAEPKKLRSGGDKKTLITTTLMGYLFAMLSGVFFFITRIPHENSSLDYNLLFGILFALLYVVVIILGFVLKDNLLRAYTAAVIGRYIFAVLSGFIFFGSYAWEGFGAVSYSLVYNAIYIFAEAALTIVILLLPPVKKAMQQLKRLATE